MRGYLAGRHQPYDKRSATPSEGRSAWGNRPTLAAGRTRWTLWDYDTSLVIDCRLGVGGGKELGCRRVLNREEIVASGLFATLRRARDIMKHSLACRVQEHLSGLQG